MLTGIEVLSMLKNASPDRIRSALLVVLLTGTILGLSACGNKEKKAGQSLARVNGIDITVLQVNDELARSGVKPEQQAAATRQLLESLIDRQLLLSEAMRNEVDRNADVVQAIERAKTQIIIQAHMRRIASNIINPSAAEIDDFYQKHPEYFTQRKQFDVQQLVIASRDFSNELRAVVDAAKTLETITPWMDKHGVRYVRGQFSRSITDMPEQIGDSVKEMHKGQVFIVNEGENSMINLITNIRISPVSAKAAEPQIEQFLVNKKVREAAETEIAHLRSSAKIEYINASAPAAH